MAGQVPKTFPITVPQGGEHRYQQEVSRDARITGALAWFPEGTRTDLKLTLRAAGEPINETDATEDSEPIPDHIFGSGVVYRFDLALDVFEGQTVGVDADNQSPDSALDAFVKYGIDYDIPTEGR